MHGVPCSHVIATLCVNQKICLIKFLLQKKPTFIFDMNCAEGLIRLLREEAEVHTANSMRRKIIRVDPKINSYKNSRYALKLLKELISLQPLALLNHWKLCSRKIPKWRIIRLLLLYTGGKVFIKKLRAKGVHCPVLVFFYGNYDKHWACQEYVIQAVDNITY